MKIISVKNISILVTIILLILVSSAKILLFNDSNTSNQVEDFADLGDFIIPIDNFIVVTAGYGYYDPWGTGVQTLHTGVDFVGKKDSAILSVANGVVEKITSTGNGYGNCIIIKHITAKGKEFSTLYAHMKEVPKLNVGDKVSEGDKIGIQGTTGNSTGDHLHFEIRINNKPINPEPYVLKKGAKIYV